MSRKPAAQEDVYGYLSAWESPEHGCMGGYLIISDLGRPLEFHCSAPIRPSRAQQILFGPTLGPYLIGEQIAGVLFRSAQMRPRVILTDHPDVLWVRSQLDLPVVLVEPSDESAGDLGHMPIKLHFSPGYKADAAVVEPLIEILRKHVELLEPFARIHEAIREAHRIGEKGIGENVQAA